MDVKIKYDGKYPNLCAGILKVEVLDKGKIRRFTFPSHALTSGGGVTFDKNWSEDITSGAWSINEWPKEVPKKYRDAILAAVNDEVPQGCCGGCV